MPARLPGNDRIQQDTRGSLRVVSATLGVGVSARAAKEGIRLHMPVIESKIDLKSETFASNRAAMLALIDEVKGLENKIREHSARARPKFEKRGQLLPRERLALLLDRDKPFVPISSLVGYRMHDDDGDESISGGGQIAGIGTVAGVNCAILASDSPHGCRPLQTFQSLPPPAARYQPRHRGRRFRGAIRSIDP